MSRQTKQKKQMLASLLALAMLSTGTLAWQSFSQLATNEIIEKVDMPGARLHDYFNGSNKDVFVENYRASENASDVYARIRLSEYFEYGKNAGTVEAFNPTILRGDIENDTTPILGDQDTWDIYLYGTEDDTETENIRTYRSLVLGGETIYVSTFNQDNTDLTGEVNGTFAGTDGDGAINSSSRYDDYTEYIEDVMYPGIISSNTDTDGDSVSHKAKMTSNATITTMEEWIDDGKPIGDIWVFDETGWAYYAKPIPGGTASGLLLDAIKMESNPSDEWYYAVDVTAQLATFGDWGDKPEDSSSDGTGMYVDMTAESLDLLNVVSSYDGVQGPDIDDEDDAGANPPVENSYIIKEFKVYGTSDGGEPTEITGNQQLNVGDELILSVEVTADDDTTPDEIQGVDWSILETNRSADSLDISSTFVDGVFKPVEGMGGNSYILRAESQYDSEKFLNITVEIEEEGQEQENPYEVLNLESRDLYADMDTADQEMYKELALGLYNGEDHIYVSESEIDEQTFNDLIFAVMSDFYEMFWIPSGWTGVLESALVKPTYTVDFADVPDMQAEIDQEVQKYVNTLTEEMSEYEIIEHTYRYVTDHVSYVFADHHQSIYGALVDQEAVCAGYAKLFKYLTLQQGIDTSYITGVAYVGEDSEAHAWNVVELENEYYYVDSTWGDCYEENGIYNYYYLMQSYDKMSSSHVLYPVYNLEPSKFGTKYNYGIKNNIVFDSYDADALKTAWSNMYKEGMFQFDVEYTNEQVFIEACNALITEGDVFSILTDVTGKSLANVGYGIMGNVTFFVEFSEVISYNLDRTIDIKLGKESRF